MDHVRHNNLPHTNRRSLLARLRGKEDAPEATVVVGVLAALEVLGQGSVALEASGQGSVALAAVGSHNQRYSGKR